MLTKERIYEIYDRVIEENKQDIENEKKQAKIENIIKYIMIIAIILVAYKVSQLPIVYDAYMTIIKMILSINLVFLNELFLHILMPYWLFISICTVLVIRCVDYIMTIKFYNYIHNFNDRMLKKVTETYSRELEYSPVEGMDIKNYINEAEFEKIVRYLSADLVKSTLANNGKLEIARIGISYITGLYRKSIMNLVVDTLDLLSEKIFATFDYTGLLAKAEFSTDFNMSLYLRGYIHPGRESFRKFKIEFDSVEFEKIFDVYSSDEKKAKVLLNEEIIQTIMKFFIESHMIYEMTIKNNYIYIKFETGKIFSHSLYAQEPITKEGLYTYYKVYDFIVDITNKLIDAAKNAEKEI